MEYLWKVSISTAKPPMSVSDVTGQYNKIGGIAFWSSSHMPKCMGANVHTAFSHVILHIKA